MKGKGLTFTELLVVISSVTMVTGVLMPALNGSRQTAVRLVCETNLRGIGRAMTVYATENGGHFPRAGGVGSYWSNNGVIHDWDAPTEYQAFGLAAPPGRATVTSSFFLLVKYGKVTPKSFICKGDSAVEFRLTEQRTRVRNLYSVWDFGYARQRSGSSIYPGGYCSYSYHMPYAASPTDVTNYAIIDGSNPGSPVCADRNPHLDRNVIEPNPDRNVIEPNVMANSAAHWGKGQNVLYKDGSVKFEKSPTVGISGDNIYTYGGDPAGIPPVGNGDGFPAGEKDAYLVGERN